MTWIRTVPYEMADRRLKKIYKPFRVYGRIDNILLAHGLRPHTLQGHMALYGSVLYHSANTVPRWLLEAIAAYAGDVGELSRTLKKDFTFGNNACHAITPQWVTRRYIARFLEDRAPLFEGHARAPRHVRLRTYRVQRRDALTRPVQLHPRREGR